MSSQFTPDRMSLTFTKDQENNMNTSLKKRSSEEGDVAGPPKTKIQGRGHINHPTYPSNTKKGVSVRKRNVGDDGEMPTKRMRCSNLGNSTEHSEGLVEATTIKGGMKKASVDAGPPEKNTRCITNNTNPTEPSVISAVVEPKKRKASDDGEAPEKRRRCSNNNSSSLELDLGSFEGESDFKQNLNKNTKTEEERIFEMSSPKNVSRGGFTEKYCQLHPLGKGGFGSVFNGFRRLDRLPVAIKRIHHEDVRYETVTSNGKEYTIVREVAFMLKATGLQGSIGQSAAVSLLDWYILKNELVLVMEKPVQSMNLFEYLSFRRGSLDELEAKMILKQLVDAAIDLHSKGVFHRDIKLHNILIQMDSDVPRVRIIDFGCSIFSTDLAYDSLCGTLAFLPPEWFDSKSYWARTTTVWQLGALFYCLVTGRFFTTLSFIKRRHRISSALSKEVKTLLRMCLAREPSFRATLGDLQRNPALRNL